MSSPLGPRILSDGCGTRPRPERRSTLIHVALAVDAPLLRDVLLELLRAEPDIELIDCMLPTHARSPAEPAQPDVVILSTSDPDDDEVPVRLLRAAPRCRVLALRSDARASWLYELRPHRSSLGELSRDALLAALRGSAGPADAIEDGAG
jgi:DNA-binding NarL/FixJ family response regulator